VAGLPDALPATPAAAADKPNIVLINVDDFGGLNPKLNLDLRSCTTSTPTPEEQHP
jgi:hypothetical protein